MHNFTNKEISKILNEFSNLMKINGANKFKVRAYTNASRIIGNLSTDIKQLLTEDEASLQEIDGIGKGIASTIKEIFEKGFCPDLEKLRDELPTGLLELIKISGIGPARANILYEKLGVENLESLKKALNNGEVQKLQGFGPKSEEKLLKSINHYEKYRDVIIISDALKLSSELINFFQRETDLIKKAIPVGDVRRHQELVNEIKFLLLVDDLEQTGDYISGLPFADRILDKSQDIVTVVTDDDIKLDFILVKDEDFIYSLHYYTGSEKYISQLAKRAEEFDYEFNESGLFKDGKKIDIDAEEDIYKNLNMDYVIPELREGQESIKAAITGDLPDSILFTDIKGDLHAHSEASDGAYSMEDMIEAAIKRGYQYIAITDHSQSLKVAHGLSPEKLLEQGRQIDKLQKKYEDITILKGIEVDILADGSLDYSDEILSKLDLVIASIHTGFNQSKEQITDRIVKAMNNQYVNIIGHPRGRILGRRQSYQVDMERVIDMASKTGTCLEINASPYRLDLNDILVKRAQERGVKISINTDSHYTEELDDMALGVGVARRGWLESNDVINTMEIDELRKFLRGG